MRIAPVLERVENLMVQVVECENLLFGDVVTVSGLLNFKSLKGALARVPVPFDTWPKPDLESIMDRTRGWRTAVNSE